MGDLERFDQQESNLLVVFAIGSIGLQTTPTCQACFDLFLCSQMCTVASHGRQMPKARLSQSSRPLQCSKLRHNTPAQHSCEVHDLDCIILYYLILYCIVFKVFRFTICADSVTSCRATLVHPRPI